MKLFSKSQLNMESLLCQPSPRAEGYRRERRSGCRYFILRIPGHECTDGPHLPVADPDRTRRHRLAAGAARARAAAGGARGRRCADVRADRALHALRDFRSGPAARRRGIVPALQVAVIRPISDAAEHPTPEDWRILRALSFYRLLLVTLLILLHQGGVLSRVFDDFRPARFYYTCVAYAIAALLLMLPIVYRRPRVGLQAHLQFFVDTAAITALAWICGGVPSGLGMLMLTSAVGCSMVISQRMALVQAAGVTLTMFAEEAWRLYPEFDTGPITQTGILGLMFFATSWAANAVAMRARKSELLAAQAGSDLANLAQLNESVIEHMQTGVA